MRDNLALKRSGNYATCLANLEVLGSPIAKRHHRSDRRYRLRHLSPLDRDARLPPALEDYPRRHHALACCQCAGDMDRDFGLSLLRGA